MFEYDGFEPSGCVVSEKYDGICVRWTGQQLVTRDGHALPAPEWFTRRLGASPFTAELWAGRGRFETVLSISQRADGDWLRLKLMIFEGTSTCCAGHVQHVAERALSDVFALLKFYGDVLAAGGEGVVIRTPDGTLYKCKPEAEDDGEVVAYTPGKGRNAGLVGALVVRDRQGRQFKLGSGLCDETRRCPPPVGAIVAFTYQGRTRRGVPRFASYLRVRGESALNF